MNGYNFTDRVRKVLQLAREEAHRLGHEYVGTEHILLAIIREGEGVAQAVLTNLNVDLEEISRRIEETVKKGKAAVPARPDLPYTSRAKKVLEFSMSEARELNDKYVGTEHLLLGVLREEKGIGALVLTEAGVTLEAARSEVVRMLRTEMPEVSATTPPVTPPVPYTPDARGSLQLALQEARDLKAASLGPELLLLGVLRVMLTAPPGSASATLATLLNAAGLTPERVREVIARGDQA
ncbi:MAG TPA: Clp protease N-terminal domain-containing protein [Gemmatimonadales bacterium]|nr:Clp protease N-terminal domain-containing protein [Gemmatimonadales bacterium]